MKRFTAVLALAAILGSGTQLAAAGVKDLNTVKEGDAVPAFKGRNLAGEEIDVGALLGRKVLVLAFWSIYCKPCVEEISGLVRLQEQFGGDKLEVIGVNEDSELGLARIRTFVGRFEEFEKRRINYPLIFDEDSAISKQLGVGFLPTVLSINLNGRVERIFTGFEEKSEAEILAGIRRLLPLEGEEREVAEEATIFPVEAVVPLCGFYDSQGWKASFQENYDLQRETERIAEISRRAALKAALQQALASIGVNLMYSPQGQGCFTERGVYLVDDPFRDKDCLTNLLGSLPAEKLARVLESQEDFFGDEYRVSQRVAVNIPDLKTALENQRVQLTPHTVTFNIVNLRKLDLQRFEQALVRQSRYIGVAAFPAYTVYTSTENFAAEVKGMDFGGLRLFVEEAEGDRIEIEAWR